MVDFIVKNLINGKLTVEKVKTSKTYSKYFEEIKEELEANGYTIKKNKIVKQ